jgi:hypothetical protein
VSGAVGGGVAAAAAGYLGVTATTAATMTLGQAVTYGAVIGAASGGASGAVTQIVDNVLNCRPWGYHVPEALLFGMGTGAVMGGAGGAIGYGIRSLFRNQYAVPASGFTPEEAAMLGPEAGGGGEGTITVYRVEGDPNARLIISDAGDVSIVGDQRLHLNFSEEERALEFFIRRVNQGMPGVKLKAFEVNTELLDLTQSSAVPQLLGKLFRNAPQIVDSTIAPNQFGFPESWFPIIESYVVPGSGRIVLR